MMLCDAFIYFIIMSALKIVVHVFTNNPRNTRATKCAQNVGEKLRFALISPKGEYKCHRFSARMTLNYY